MAPFIAFVLLKESFFALKIQWEPQEMRMGVWGVLTEATMEEEEDRRNTLGTLQHSLAM